MKKQIIIIMTVCLYIILSSSIAFADVCQEWQDMDLLPFGDLKDEMNEKFPFSIIAAAVNIFTQLSNTSADSPSEITWTVFQVDMHPFYFLTFSGADTMMQAFRIILLAFVIVSLAKHVIYKIL